MTEKLVHTEITIQSHSFSSVLVLLHNISPLWELGVGHFEKIHTCLCKEYMGADSVFLGYVFYKKKDLSTIFTCLKKKQNNLLQGL